VKDNHLGVDIGPKVDTSLVVGLLDILVVDLKVGIDLLEVLDIRFEEELLGNLLVVHLGKLEVEHLGNLKVGRLDKLEVGHLGILEVELLDSLEGQLLDKLEVVPLDILKVQLLDILVVDTEVKQPSTTGLRPFAN